MLINESDEVPIMSEEEQQELLVDFIFAVQRKGIRASGPVVNELLKAVETIAKVAEKKLGVVAEFYEEKAKSWS